uniref:Uncharacterized protein n=1 Tax=viral metagenome TaxID=1070528 RepID=A0A6H1Z9P0_9ZZZZ
MIIKVWDENCQLKCKLRLAPQDIEEAIGRCGWMCLNDAEEVTPEDGLEIKRIEAQGYAGMVTQNSQDALKWWKERKV